MRRPLVILALALVRLAAGFSLAYPLAAVAAESGVGSHPEGDRLLFESGGYALLELLRLQGPDLLATFRGLLPLLAAGLLLTAAGNAVLLVALDTEGPLELRDWLPRSAERLPGLLLIGAGAALAQLVLLIAGSGLLASGPDWMARPVAETAVELTGWLVVFALVAALGGFADVAKACLVRHDGGVGRALGLAIARLRTQPLRACFGWLPYGLVFLASVLAAAQLTAALDVSRPGAFRWALVLLGHQLVILVAIAMRAAWYARALRLAAS